MHHPAINPLPPVTATRVMAAVSSRAPRGVHRLGFRPGSADALASNVEGERQHRKRACWQSARSPSRSFGTRAAFVVPASAHWVAGEESRRQSRTGRGGLLSVRPREPASPAVQRDLVRRGYDAISVAYRSDDGQSAGFLGRRCQPLRPMGRRTRAAAARQGRCGRSGLRRGSACYPRAD